MLQTPIAVLPGTLVEEDVMDDAVKICQIYIFILRTIWMLPTAFAKKIVLETVEMRKRGLSSCFGL
jgi:hypothetical protein